MVADVVAAAEGQIEKGATEVYVALSTPGKGMKPILSISDDMIAFTEKATPRTVSLLDETLNVRVMKKVREDYIEAIKLGIKEIEKLGFDDSTKKELNDLMIRYLNATAKLKNYKPFPKAPKWKVEEFVHAAKTLEKERMLWVAKTPLPVSDAFVEGVEQWKRALPQWIKNSRKTAETMIKGPSERAIIEHMIGKKGLEPQWKYWVEFGKERFPKIFTWKADSSEFLGRHGAETRELLYKMIDETVKNPTDVYSYVHPHSREVAVAVVKEYSVIVDGKATDVGVHLFFDITEKGPVLNTIYASADMTDIGLHKLGKAMINTSAKIIGKGAVLVASGPVP